VVFVPFPAGSAPGLLRKIVAWKFITAITTERKKAYGKNREPLIYLEAAPGFESGNKGFAVLKNGID